MPSLTVTHWFNSVIVRHSEAFDITCLSTTNGR